MKRAPAGALLCLCGEPLRTAARACGPGIIRDMPSFDFDAAVTAPFRMQPGLRKLAAGRVQHAVTGKSFLEYHQRRGGMVLNIHPPLVVKSWLGQCAISPHSAIGTEDLNRALAAMSRDGTMAAVLARYR